jgi:hypothetical protein
MHTYLLPDYHLYFAIQDVESYHPESILRLFPSLPSASICATLKVIAIASTLTLIVGLFSRTSLWTCFLSNLALTDVVHGLNGGSSIALHFLFLTQVGLLFGDVGACWSLDSLWRRRHNVSGQWPISQSRWPVYLAQLLITLVFFNAFWWKWRSGGYRLDWAFSDNLRNWLLFRYDVWDEPRPTLAAWALQAAWRYKLAALMNLISQALPILACLVVHRPWLRLLFGGFFLLETLGLGLVIGFWCIHWLPLLVLFVDWEVVVGWVASRRHSAPQPATGLIQTRSKWSWGASVYITLILGWYGSIAFYRYDRMFFPFAGSTPFCSLLVKQPISAHQTFEVAYHRIEIDDKPLPMSRFTTWLYYNYRGLHLLTDPELTRRALGVLQRATSCDEGAVLWEIGGMPRLANWDPVQRQRIVQAWSQHSSRLAILGKLQCPNTVTLKKVIFRFPKYPGEPRAVPICEGMMARLDPSGRFLMVTARPAAGATPAQAALTMVQQGLCAPAYRLSVFHPGTGEQTPLTGRWDGDRLVYDRAPSTAGFLLIYVRDEKLGSGEHLFLGPQLY